MASFTGVGDNLELAVLDKGESVDIAISGTYNMTILFQRETVAGGDAWETLQTFNTANATEAETYVTRSYGENLRLIVDVDTSGTATATLTNAAAETYEYLTLRDRVGNLVQEWTQGPVRVIHGGERHSTGGIVDVTAATVTITAREHAGRIVTLNRSGGIAVTLPAALGTGDVYTFFVGTTFAGAATIKVASSSDSMSGGVGLSTDIAGVTVPALAADDTITWSGTTTGGVVGSWVKITDVAVGKFMVEGFLISTGSEADPFSNTVS